MVMLALQDARGRNRLYGRLAGLLFLGSGLVTLATLPLPAASGLNRVATVVVGVTALVAGVITWVAPWDRWPRRTSLVLVPVALALIAGGNAFGGSAPLTYGIFFIVVFVWIGISHPPWTSAAMAPLAAVAYVVPILVLPGTDAVSISSAAITIPVCVLVGESLAWIGNQLSRTEQALAQERETATRLRAVDELRSTFMSAVSHELRTPITICRGHLEVLGSNPAPQEFEETLRMVVDELGRMGRIVADITTFVSMEDPGFLRKERVPLDGFVSEVAARAAPLLGDRLAVGASTERATISADPQRLTQAVINLLDNAAVHTTGSVHLSLARDDGAWRFDVTDEGGGLPAGREMELFEPFVRGNTSAQGSGLGLAIVRRIAEAHGGSAGVENRPGRGATFWIRLPGSVPV